MVTKSQKIYKMKLLVWLSLIVGSWLLIIGLAGLIVLFFWSIDLLLQ